MWYLASPKEIWEQISMAKDGIARPIGYAESEDGVTWVKPNLGLVDFRGTRENNLVLIEPSGHPLSICDDFFTVLYDPDVEGSDGLYKLAYIVYASRNHIWEEEADIPEGMDSPWHPAMMCAVSSDGLRWRTTSDHLPIREKFEVAALYRFCGTYFVLGQQHTPWIRLPGGESCGRVMTTFYSPDFRTWSQDKALSFVRPGYDSVPLSHGEEVHMAAGISNRNNVLVGVYGMWHGAPGPAKNRLENVRIDLGMVISNDGIHFREPSKDYTLIRRGRDGEWDNIGLCQGHAMENVGDKTYVWYGHWDCTESGGLRGIGLATLERDRFGGLSPAYPGRSSCFTSCLVETDEEESVFLNVKGVSQHSPIVVTLIDEKGKELPGYRSDESMPLTHEGFCREVAWKGGKHLPTNGRFRIKVAYPKVRKERVPSVYALYIRKTS